MATCVLDHAQNPQKCLYGEKLTEISLLLSACDVDIIQMAQCFCKFSKSISYHFKSFFSNNFSIIQSKRSESWSPGPLLIHNTSISNTKGSNTAIAIRLFSSIQKFFQKPVWKDISSIILQKALVYFIMTVPDRSSVLLRVSSSSSRD